MTILVIKFLEVVQRTKFNFIYSFELLDTDYPREKGDQKVIVWYELFETPLRILDLFPPLKKGNIYRLTFPNDEFSSGNYDDKWKIHLDTLSEVKDITNTFSMSERELIGLKSNLSQARRELEGLKSNVESKLGDAQKFLTSALLSYQEQLTRLKEDEPQLFSLTEKQLNRFKQSLKDKLTGEEIIKLCQLQNEITASEIRLESLQKQFQTHQEIPPK